MKKVYCEDCGELLNRWACYKKNIRCRSCKNKFLFTGKNLTEKTKQRMRMVRLGKKCYAWKGGCRTYYSKMAKAIYFEHNINVICEHCGLTKKIHIHHKDENWKNNNIQNLQALCIKCHNKHHKYFYYQYLKRNKLGRFV